MKKRLFIMELDEVSYQDTANALRIASMYEYDDSVAHGRAKELLDSMADAMERSTLCSETIFTLLENEDD